MAGRGNVGRFRTVRVRRADDLVGDADLLCVAPSVGSGVAVRRRLSGVQRVNSPMLLPEFSLGHELALVREKTLAK